uniref:protein-tyrosine-phosphatase n=1 Tax=Dicentrarchus labrax TaxID=13489 RepID=A0A8C4NRK7_DICLA
PQSSPAPLHVGLLRQQRTLNLIPCTYVPDALGDGPALKQRCFEDINECIDASTGKRKRVLVHCRDGFSLAPTCIIQYLMVKQNMRLIAAYELLRAKYPVNIRECHQNVLVSLERALRPGGNVDPDYEFDVLPLQNL